MASHQQQQHQHQHQKHAPPPPQGYPTAPNIPLPAVQSLIPRLTTTINDIDTFSMVLVQGEADGSMPSWDALLQRYSLLMGRINSLSTYISQPPAKQLNQSLPTPSRPALESFLVHPLNPLPSSTDTTANGANGVTDTPLDPIATETFFQVLNTQSLPLVHQDQAGALDHVRAKAAKLAAAADSASGSGSGPGAVAGADRSIPWRDKDELKQSHAVHGDGPLSLLRTRLDERLKRECTAARKLIIAIREKEEQYDWVVRIDGGDEEDKGDVDGDGDGDGDGNGDGDGDGNGNGAEGADGKGDGDDHDGLFDDDDEPAPAPAPPPPASAPAPAPNPREGWSVADYVRYMENGRPPTTTTSAAGSG